MLLAGQQVPSIYELHLEVTSVVRNQPTNQLLDNERICTLQCNGHHTIAIIRFVFVFSGQDVFYSFLFSLLVVSEPLESTTNYAERFPLN